MLREVRRVVRPGGTVAIFDGDYASLTFAYPDPALANTIEGKLMQLIVANPRIMRDLPRLLREVDLDLVDADGRVYADIGTGSFWPGAAESYGVLMARAGLLLEAVTDDWRAASRYAWFGGPSLSRMFETRSKDPRPGPV